MGGILEKTVKLRGELFPRLVNTTSGKEKQIGVMLKLSDTPGTVRTSPPERGQHTEEVIRKLGYSSQEISEMARSGIIQTTVRRRKAVPHLCIPATCMVDKLREEVSQW